MNFRVATVSDETKIIVQKNNKPSVNSLQMVLKEEKHWNCVADFLYSGVNILVKSIERNCASISNASVESIVHNCQPTTFLTRKGLGEPYHK